MKDSLDGILYVGKAKNLKKRVQSYFRHSANHSPKIKKLVQHLKDFDYILTDTEFEAFILECQYIKKLKPPYNRQMKNPLSFVYIVIHMNVSYRRIEISSMPISKDDAFIFGPYTNIKTVEKAIEGIEACFKIQCSNPTSKGSACLNYGLGLCMGMCLGDSALVQYHLIVDKIIRLLKGTDITILEEMNDMMQQAALKFDFETAAKYRDFIQAVQSLLNKERVIEFTEENKNIIVIEMLNEQTFKLFLIKRTEILFSKRYELDGADFEQLISTIKATINTYFNTKGKISFLDVSRDEIDEAQIIFRYLTSNNCHYFFIEDNWLRSKTNVKLEKALTVLLKNIYSP